MIVLSLTLNQSKHTFLSLSAYMHKHFCCDNKAYCIARALMAIL
ncbi:hypothetical protein HMPREF1577_00709 [Gardnerella pickettii JCP8017A]|uniref:Uncharacterized protein n=1 Tax=Gardnerella pickettii JCP8017A TaxID=1261062 RepID=T2PKX3_9BIFI|nr:hypothetical protein HMPREF1577_00709 [Gardnerella pickettii JCP8017A]EPI61483.1 hypothetical protein HMPREF1578_00940 [Gardnerella pickettii JCP8017B]